MVFCKPVAVAAAVVRRDGRVQAVGHPVDHVRLGVAEERLDALCGERGVIDKVAAGAALKGRVKGMARQATTAAMVIRLVLLMTLMPGSCYVEAIATLLGDLPLVPWHRRYLVPTRAVACTWRETAGPAPLEQLRDRALAAIDAEHRDHDWRAVLVGPREVCSIDGSLTRMPDTPGKRDAFESVGTADGSAPYPQLRELCCSIVSTRATVGVVTGPSGAGGGRDKGEAEQKLLDGALERYPHVLNTGPALGHGPQLPGVPRIKALLVAGTHVLIRVRDGITLSPHRALPARRVLSRSHLRRGPEAGHPRDRIPGHRRRARHPGAVLAHHRPDRPLGLSGRRARGRLPLAVDRDPSPPPKEAKSAIRDAGPSTGRCSAPEPRR